MKNFILSLFAFVLVISCTSCTQKTDDILNMEPKISHMNAICELAVMDCYYHNVAKFFEEDASGFLLWKKDKHFWVEYSGIVTLGIDISQVNIVIDDTDITITMPEATVLDYKKIDSKTLDKENFIVDKDSAPIEAADEIKAFKEAQEELKRIASQDKVLLQNAKQRAMSLLEEYINNISTAVGKQYTIHWKDLNGGSSTETTIPDTTATS